MEKEILTHQEILKRTEIYTTLRDLVPKSIRSYLNMTSMFLKWCDQNHIDPNGINIDQIYEYCFYLKKIKQYSSRTYNTNMAVLRLVLNHILKIPVDKTILPNAKVDIILPEILTQEEVITFIDTVQNLKYKTMIILLYSCGLRISEACSLSWNDISRKNKTIHIAKSKSRIDRYVPISDTIIDALILYWKQCGTSRKWVFPGRNGDEYISKASVNSVIKKTLKDLNWEHRKISAHTFRRCAGTHLYESGCDLHTIQRLLGHKVLSSTLIYIRTSKFHNDYSNPYDTALNNLKGSNHNGK